MKHLKDAIQINNDPGKNEIFVIIKPGFLQLSKEIMKMILNAGFILTKSRVKLLQREEARKLYKIHKDKDFYKDLCKYMASGLSIGLLFRYDGDPFKAFSDIKDSIREKYGESDMRNVIHSADSYEHMLEEQQMYFG